MLQDPFDAWYSEDEIRVVDTLLRGEASQYLRGDLRAGICVNGFVLPTHDIEVGCCAFRRETRRDERILLKLPEVRVTEPEKEFFSAGLRMTDGIDKPLRIPRETT